MPPSASMGAPWNGQRNVDGRDAQVEPNDGPGRPSWMVVGGERARKWADALLPVAKSTVEINTLDVAGMTNGGGAGPPGAVENDSMTVAGMFIGRRR